MLCSMKKQIQGKMIENLLLAHRRVAVSGSIVDLIKLTRYLLRLVNKGEDVLTDVVPEDDQ